MAVEGNKVEKKEGVPLHSVVIVDFLRHGSTDYLESRTTTTEKEAMAGNYPRDLTPKGEEEVRRNAKPIIDAINPDEEIVVLWSSPAWRAQGAEEIIRELLSARGVQVYRNSALASMRNFDQKDEAFMVDLWKRLAPVGAENETFYSRDPAFQEVNDKFETISEVRKRADRVYNAIRYLAEHAKLGGKKLHIIGVSHFEFLNPIMEDLFEFKVEDRNGIKKGENLRVLFDYDQVKGQIAVEADFRGLHKDRINFDKNKRKFVINQE